MGVLLRRHRHHAFITLLVFLIVLASVSLLHQLGVEGEGRVSGMSEKRQNGPGSWPPSCRSKCGNCTPCKPVHVPIHPGLTLPQEYYPEAWRCKCGNKLYMP